MKVSLNIASYYNSIHNSGKNLYEYGVDEIVRRIGSQLGAVEDVIDTRQKYENVIVVKVVECDKHPDADKLSLCLIDDSGVVSDVHRNEQGLVQVVCGAPNVRAGMFALWLPPGSTVPSTFASDPFVLEARELRGKVSNGMLASPKELDISEEHEGILEVNPSEFDHEIKPGEDGGALYNLGDVIIDCENKMFTHRPDCFGVIGVAREIAGIFGDAYTSPDWYVSALNHAVDASLPFTTKNDVQEKVPRFMVQSLSDVTVKSSPVWLQAYLKRIDSNSINNIVDYTNYFMQLTGQPIHAYDYDKVQQLSSDGAQIYPRMAEEGETIELLNGKTVTLTTDDIVIATDKKAIGLAGVMGGSETEVDDSTKNVIIECANFDMYTIRRTSMRHGLFTDAVTRFNKGQSPLQNDRVLAKIVQEIVLYADGKVASKVHDVHGFDLNKDNLNHVSVAVNFINERLGTALTASEIKRYLENVEFTVDITDNELHITAPFWRMDIAIAEDIVEEVGRMHGYQNVPVALPPRSSKAAPLNQVRAFRKTIRDALVKNGANEVLTYSFVHSDLLQKSYIDPEKWAIHIRNALSPDLQYYRPSLLPSLLAKLSANLKADAGKDNNEFALFEFGKAHVKDHMEAAPEDNIPKQMRRISFVFTADAKSAKRRGGSAYYVAKKYLDLITNGQAVYKPLETNEYPLTAPYQKERSAVVMLNDTAVGVVGEFRSKTKRGFKLPDYCAGFEVDTDLLSAEITPYTYEPLSEFPSSSQDITYEVKDETTWGQLYDLLHAELAVAKAESGYEYTVTPREIFKQDESDKKRITFHIELRHHQKTLKTDEINTLLAQISDAIGSKLHAARI